MKNSFKIFSVIVGLLVVLIILRLNSISYPRDIEDNTEVVYLEELHDYGSLFDIEYHKDGFRLEPLVPNISVNGRFTGKTIEIKDNDLITVEGRKFLFNEFPRTTAFKEIYRRPIQEVFYPGSISKFIGGWLTTNRHQVISQKDSQALLKKLLVEIAADELKRIMPGGGDVDGKLLELRKDSEDKKTPPNAFLVKSFHLPIIHVRNWQETQVKPGIDIEIRDDDILKIPYQNKEPGEALYLKFNIPRLLGVDYLCISYKENIRQTQSRESHEPGEYPQAIAFLKSLDTGISYSLNTKKKNAFIGNKGLFSFTLAPARLFTKLYVPDKIPEGGIVDFKELLDRRMYYKKSGLYYPVTLEFLNEVRKGIKNKSTTDIRSYFEKHNITWRQFSDYREFKHFSGTAESIIHKMENKGIYREFRREIGKLNRPHHILGVGLGMDRQLIKNVAYKPGGHSWLSAVQVRENTPIVSGVSTFYWGTAIKESDEPVQFRVRFTQTPPPVKLIAAADYEYSLDGKTYTKRNFFDGLQTISFPGGKKELLVNVSNLRTFNKRIGSTNFQAEITFSHSDGSPLHIAADHTWQSSINGFHWSAPLVNPIYSLPDPAAPHLVSLWHYEKWNPVYSGIKFRYFRKIIELEEIPQSVRWKIYASGNYMLYVNRKEVRAEEDFIKALKKGRNIITVMVSRRGFRKHFYASRLFQIIDNRLLLKQKQVQRASFTRIQAPQKPLVSDSTNTPLAYSSEINGTMQRFYASPALIELLPLFGSPDQGIWGLEQIFSKLPKEDKIAGLQITINREWQTIVLETMKKHLQATRKKELNNLTYKKLKKDLEKTKTQLQDKRWELTNTPADRQQPVMQMVIQLQSEVEELEKKINKIKNHFYEASVVLMGPRGDIQAAASYPYNEETMKELNPGISPPYRPVENPYLNRSWKWKYNPGSTAKMIDAAVFLYSKDQKDEDGRYRFPYLRSLLSSESSFKDFPRYDLKGSTLLNGKEIVFRLRNFQKHTMPEGFCSLRQAFAHSYNTYFSFLSLHNHRVLTFDSLAYDSSENPRYKRYFISKANIPVAQTYREYPALAFAEKFLINRKIDLLHNLGEVPFVSKLVRMPNDAFMAAESVFPVNAYTSANVAHYSIGQGDFQLTALQNAMIAATIMNRGVLYHPFIIKSVTIEGRETPLLFDPDEDKVRLFKASIADQVKKAMRDVVAYGTADGLFKGLKKGREFYAKTGTAETELYKDNSLFVGFVTFRDGTPLVFSVIVPRSGIGAKVAGRLTEDILKALIDHENKKGVKL